VSDVDSAPAVLHLMHFTLGPAKYRNPCAKSTADMTYARFGAKY